VETWEPPLEVPDGDILVHAGDFTHRGRVPEIQAFNAWLSRLPHKHKVLTAGNHEIGLDPGTRGTEHHVDHPDLDRAASFLTDCVLLQDSSVEIMGLKFYGSPWTPLHRGMAFNLERGSAIAAKWALIPDDVDVLVTHAPPLGHFDMTHHGARAGCEDLLRAVVERIKPKLHVFGHVHEGKLSGCIIFLSASIFIVCMTCLHDSVTNASFVSRSQFGIRCETERTARVITAREWTALLLGGSGCD
jgi:Icc-related predicted phosphoesterase